MARSGSNRKTPNYFYNFSHKIPKGPSIQFVSVCVFFFLHLGQYLLLMHGYLEKQLDQGFQCFEYFYYLSMIPGIKSSTISQKRLTLTSYIYILYVLTYYKSLILDNLIIG